MHLDVLAMLAAESKSGSARINTQHFMRRAVIMRKGIDSVSPRVGPVVTGKTLFENRTRIFGVGRDRVSIDQQGQATIWENTVVVKIQLLRLNEILLLDHKGCLCSHNARKGEGGRGRSKIVIAPVVAASLCRGAPAVSPMTAQRHSDTAALWLHYLCDLENRTQHTTFYTQSSAVCGGRQRTRHKCNQCCYFLNCSKSLQQRAWSN